MSSKPVDSRISERTIVPAHHDPVRIVPLQRTEVLFGVGNAAATAGSVPNVTYRDGPLISAVEVFTLFWGSAWKAAAEQSLMHDINVFFDVICQSVLIDQLAEYSVPAFPVRRGQRIGSLQVQTPPIKPSVSDTAIQHMLQH